MRVWPRLGRPPHPLDVDVHGVSPFTPEAQDIPATAAGLHPTAAHDRHGVAHYLEPGVLVRDIVPAMNKPKDEQEFIEPPIKHPKREGEIGNPDLSGSIEALGAVDHRKLRQLLGAGPHETTLEAAQRVADLANDLAVK